MKLKDSIRTGFSFGLTSGIITTLGLIVGLHSGTQSKTAVIGGILTIAIADSFSDALGVHVSQESQDGHSEVSIWEATVATFLTKFVFALTFVAPLVLFSFGAAIWVSVFWGLSVLGLFSYIMARQQNKSARAVVVEHLFIAVLVIIFTHLGGEWIASIFS